LPGRARREFESHHDHPQSAVPRVRQAMPDAGRQVEEIVRSQWILAIAILQLSGAFLDEVGLFLAGIRYGFTRAAGINGNLAEPRNAFQLARVTVAGAEQWLVVARRC